MDFFWLMTVRYLLEELLELRNEDSAKPLSRNPAVTLREEGASKSA